MELPALAPRVALIMSRFYPFNGTFFEVLVRDVLSLIDLFDRCYKLGPCVTKEERFDVVGPLFGHIVPFKRFYLCVEGNPSTLVVRTSDTLREYNRFVFADMIRSVEHRCYTPKNLLYSCKMMHEIVLFAMKM